MKELKALSYGYLTLPEAKNFIKENNLKGKADIIKIDFSNKPRMLDLYFVYEKPIKTKKEV